MAAPTTAAYVKKTLANPEPSTHGPRPTPPDRPVGWVRLVEGYGRALGGGPGRKPRRHHSPVDTRAIIRALQWNCSNSAIIASWGDVRQESRMRRIALAMLVATGYVLVGASGASAAPASGAAIAELGHLVDQVMQVRESCGRGRHRSSGRCVPGCGPGWFQPYPQAPCRPR
jgi:hypothetical protein